MGPVLSVLGRPFQSGGQGRASERALARFWHNPAPQALPVRPLGITNTRKASGNATFLALRPPQPHWILSSTLGVGPDGLNGHSGPRRCVAARERSDSWVALRGEVGGVYGCGTDCVGEGAVGADGGGVQKGMISGAADVARPEVAERWLGWLRPVEVAEFVRVVERTAGEFVRAARPAPGRIGEASGRACPLSVAPLQRVKRMQRCRRLHWYLATRGVCLPHRRISLAPQRDAP